jgi:hypothetical protein
MSWQEDICNAILDDETVTDLIDDRLFADVAPGEAVAPLIVYQQISEEGETMFDGTRDIIFPLVQFTCWSETKLGAIALASALRNAIEGKNLDGASLASLGFSNQESRRDQQTKLFCEQIDYRVSCYRN